MNKESAYKKIADLVSRFEEHSESYKNSDYNETQTRRDFIDPFFKAIGWDIDNEQGLAEAYREVIHEDKLKIDESTKAPDYCFTIYGQKKFYVEAKKPSVEIKDANAPAYQIRRYGWSAKLPISILTDFEEFAIYDCIKKPNPTDKPAVSRIKYLTYKEYLTEFDFLYDTFSKENILKGSFDKFVVSSINKKGTSSVDSEFLKSMEEWRKSLALNIALRNDSLNEDEINYTVQQTIDRLIFLRICEDRKIEAYGTLKSIADTDSIYKKLFQYFQKADDKYNSGLFDFKKDKLSHNLNIDNKLLKSIIAEMYYPVCPYEFSVIPVEILGNSYEQFLGSVIRLTGGHHAKVEVKPEVRKAGGVYYTPQYIVEYIVKNTVGKLIENKTPAEISEIKILDPACGSGSFLLGAYQYLLNYHHEWYLAKTSSGKKVGKNSPITPDGRLSTAEKKRILTNNVFGVDIDTQAVEVTKLSLLLKCLEGETEASVNEQLSLFQERVLPNLEDNIKCGNSLIDFDFYEGRLDFAPEDEKKIKPFNWDKSFTGVFKQGGFDIVIGNPPYSYIISNIEQEYYQEKYENQNYQKDLYLLFLEKYKSLLKPKGILGVIISNTWLQSVTYGNIRKYLMTEYVWVKFLHLPEKVFKAVVDTHVLIFIKFKHTNLSDNNVEIEIYEKGMIRHSHILNMKNLPSNGDVINIVSDENAHLLFSKIKNNSVPLKQICKIYNGVKPFEKGKGKPPQTNKTMEEKPFVKEGKKPGKEWSPLLRGSLINRYVNLWNNDYWIYYGEWLAAPRDPYIFKTPIKIMVRQTGDSIIGTIIEKDFIARNNLHIIIMHDPKYHINFILGILNSKLMDYFYSILNPEKGEALAEVKKDHVENLPIPQFDLTNLKHKSLYDEIVSLVETMLSLKQQSAKLPYEQEKLKSRIEYTDTKINELIYNLYGLNSDEIKLIEGRR